jgi:response regulator RpfG family c-di-GMP phosphodiesterase
MPIMNGLTMVEEIKKINPSQSVIFISAHSDTINLIKAIELGVEHFLIKPVDNQKLFDVLYKICDRVNSMRELERLKKTEYMNTIEKALEVSLLQILNAIPMPSIIINEEDLILEYNKSFEDIFDFFDDVDILDRLKSKTINLSEIISFETFQSTDWKYTMLNFDEYTNTKIEIKDKGEYIMSIGKLDDYIVCFSRVLI